MALVDHADSSICVFVQLLHYMIQKTRPKLLDFTVFAQIILVSLPEWIGQQAWTFTCHQNGLPKKLKVQELRK